MQACGYHCNVLALTGTIRVRRMGPDDDRDES